MCVKSVEASSQYDTIVTCIDATLNIKIETMCVPTLNAGNTLL